jgi:Ca2+-binding EF-hand superfamily protein/Ran GTPase-activating protein (RanGAP) involved in mRNA processing and transport
VGPFTRRSAREQSRRVSVEEAEDLSNSDCYFGPTARRQFYDRYKQLYTKPYLFTEDADLVSPRNVRDGDGYLVIPSRTRSKFAPAYPSASHLKGVERDLSMVGSGIALSDGRGLPSDDKLSPRSQFLTSCVTRPHVASPFMIRSVMTKVYDFSFQSLGDECIIEFARCLRNELPFVEDINVRDNRLSDDGLDALLHAITRGSAMLHLQHLDISQNTMGPKSARTLRSFIVTPYCSLKSLLVDNADIDDRECAAFMTAFEKNLSIKHLTMSRNSIGKSEHLNVVQPDFVTGGEAIASMLQCNLVLAHLDVSWNYLRLESSTTLAKSVFENRTLVHLNVSYNACGDAGAMMFGEALRENQCLEVLNLAYNSIGCKGAQVLANALYGNRTLRSLVLDGNCIGREGGQQLMFALCANKNEFGCDIRLHACSLSSSVGQAAAVTLPLNAKSESKSLSNVGASSADTSLFSAVMPTFGAKSSSVFSATEPTGRYTLHLHDPYDKMMATELLRLATFKKGCHFVRLDHRASPGAAKKAIQLVRKERKWVPHQSVLKGFHHQDSGIEASDDPLEILGLDALFADIDRDQSGSIDRKELMGVLNRIGLFPRTESLASVLEKYDGLLLERCQDFSAFFFHAVFQLLDSDGSGKIDADEVEDAYKMLGISGYDEKEIVEAIAAYDMSGDGEMEESEFVAFMKDKLLDRIKLQLATSALADSNKSEDGTDEPFVALLDAATQRPWRLPDDGTLEVDFLYEREAFASIDEAYRYAKIPQSSIDKLIRNITELADSKSEQEELYNVAVHDSDLKFTASQAYQLLDACSLLHPVEKKIEAVAQMLSQMLTTKDAQVLVSRTLTLRQRCRLKAEMGTAYSVLMGNPTAHYSLDLSKPKDRAALAKIAEVAQSEKLFSKHKSCRADTSQHGNWENFRNEEFDGEKLVLTTAFFHVMPRRGKLSFDYVSTTRPKKGTHALSDRRFQQLITELQSSISLPKERGDSDDDDNEEETQVGTSTTTSDASLSKLSLASTVGIVRPSTFSKLLLAGNMKPPTDLWDKTRALMHKKEKWKFAMVSQHARFRFTARNTTKESVALKLVQIESTVCDRWLSCAQAAQIIACMPPQFLARPETARILFSRLIDIDNFHEILDALDVDDQCVCVHSLGWLNVINPMVPERKYVFDLSIHDEREMTKLLVQLAIAEPGENWVNQSFSLVRGEPGLPGWKLPVRWEKEDPKDGGGVNHSGFLQLEYYSREDRGCAPLPAFRKALMSSVLAGTKLYCI